MRRLTLPPCHITNLAKLTFSLAALAVCVPDT